MTASLVRSEKDLSSEILGALTDSTLAIVSPDGMVIGQGVGLAMGTDEVLLENSIRDSSMIPDVRDPEEATIAGPSFIFPVVMTLACISEKGAILMDLEQEIGNSLILRCTFRNLGIMSYEKVSMKSIPKIHGVFTPETTKKL